MRLAISREDRYVRRLEKVTDSATRYGAAGTPRKSREEEISMNSLLQLKKEGQSVGLDYIRRSFKDPFDELFEALEEKRQDAQAHCVR